MVESKELAQIICGCRTGSNESFRRLIDLYAARCYGYFYRLTGNRDISDDLLSKLFVKLVEKIGSFKGPAFEAWLFKVAANVFYDHLRAKQSQQKLLENHKQQLDAEIIEAKKSDDEVFDRLQRQLDKLDADTKELVLLRFYSQLGFKEIAKMRSEPIGTTLSKLHRGLKKLRQLME